MKKFNWKEIEKYLEDVSDTSKIYIGVDSSAFKRQGKWYAHFYKVIVIHKDCLHGCKIFGEVVTEESYITNKKRPTHRLWNEVYKVSELYLKLAEITDKEIEVHLDINPKKQYASSDIVEQAIGYIKGTCNVIPLVKPSAFAASYAADRLLRVKGNV
jgi:uncharacterized protein